MSNGKGTVTGQTSSRLPSRKAILLMQLLLLKENAQEFVI